MGTGAARSDIGDNFANPDRFALFLLLSRDECDVPGAASPLTLHPRAMGLIRLIHQVGRTYQ